MSTNSPVFQLLSTINSLFNLNITPTQLNLTKEFITGNFSSNPIVVLQIINNDDEIKQNFMAIMSQCAAPLSLSTKLLSLLRPDYICGENCCMLCQTPFVPLFPQTSSASLASTAPPSSESENESQTYFHRLRNFRPKSQIVTPTASCYHSVCSSCLEDYLHKYQQGFYSPTILCPGFLFQIFSPDHFMRRKINTTPPFLLPPHHHSQNIQNIQNGQNVHSPQHTQHTQLTQHTQHTQHTQKNRENQDTPIYTPCTNIFIPTTFGNLRPIFQQTQFILTERASHCPPTCQSHNIISPTSPSTLISPQNVSSHPKPISFYSEMPTKPNDPHQIYLASTLIMCQHSNCQTIWCFRCFQFHQNRTELCTSLLEYHSFKNNKTNIQNSVENHYVDAIEEYRLGAINSSNIVQHEFHHQNINSTDPITYFSDETIQNSIHNDDKSLVFQRKNSQNIHNPQTQTILLRGHNLSPLQTQHVSYSSHTNTISSTPQSSHPIQNSLHNHNPTHALFSHNLIKTLTQRHSSHTGPTTSLLSQTPLLSNLLSLQHHPTFSSRASIASIASIVSMTSPLSSNSNFTHQNQHSIRSPNLTLFTFFEHFNYQHPFAHHANNIRTAYFHLIKTISVSKPVTASNTPNTTTQTPLGGSREFSKNDQNDEKNKKNKKNKKNEKNEKNSTMSFLRAPTTCPSPILSTPIKSEYTLQLPSTHLSTQNSSTSLHISPPTQLKKTNTTSSATPISFHNQKNTEKSIDYSFVSILYHLHRIFSFQISKSFPKSTPTNLSLSSPPSILAHNTVSSLKTPLNSLQTIHNALHVHAESKGTTTSLNTHFSPAESSILHSLTPHPLNIPIFHLENRNSLNITHNPVHCIDYIDQCTTNQVQICYTTLGDPFYDPKPIILYPISSAESITDTITSPTIAIEHTTPNMTHTVPSDSTNHTHINIGKDQNLPPSTGNNVQNAQNAQNGRNFNSYDPDHHPSHFPNLLRPPSLSSTSTLPIGNILLPQHSISPTSLPPQLNNQTSFSPNSLLPMLNSHTFDPKRTNILNKIIFKDHLYSPPTATTTIATTTTTTTTPPTTALTLTSIIPTSPSSYGPASHPLHPHPHPHSISTPSASPNHHNQTHNIDNIHQNNLQDNSNNQNDKSDQNDQNEQYGQDEDILLPPINYTSQLLAPNECRWCRTRLSFGENDFYTLLAQTNEYYNTLAQITEKEQNYRIQKDNITTTQLAIQKEIDEFRLQRCRENRENRENRESGRENRENRENGRENREDASQIHTFGPNVSNTQSQSQNSGVPSISTTLANLNNINISTLTNADKDRLHRFQSRLFTLLQRSRESDSNFYPSEFASHSINPTQKHNFIADHFTGDVALQNGRNIFSATDFFCGLPKYPTTTTEPLPNPNATRAVRIPILTTFLGTSFVYSDSMRFCCDGGLVSEQAAVFDEMLTQYERYRHEQILKHSNPVWLSMKDKISLHRRTNLTPNNNDRNDQNDQNDQNQSTSVQNDAFSHNLSNNRYKIPLKNEKNGVERNSFTLAFPKVPELRATDSSAFDLSPLCSSTLHFDQSIQSCPNGSLALPNHKLLLSHDSLNDGYDGKHDSSNDTCYQFSHLELNDILSFPVYALDFSLLPPCVQKTLLCCPHILQCGCFCYGIRGECAIDCPPCPIHTPAHLYEEDAFIISDPSINTASSKSKLNNKCHQNSIPSDDLNDQTDQNDQNGVKNDDKLKIFYNKHHTNANSHNLNINTLNHTHSHNSIGSKRVNKSIWLPNGSHAVGTEMSPSSIPCHYPPGLTSFSSLSPSSFQNSKHTNILSSPIAIGQNTAQMDFNTLLNTLGDDDNVDTIDSLSIDAKNDDHNTCRININETDQNYGNDSLFLDLHPFDSIDPSIPPSTHPHTSDAASGTSDDDGCDTYVDGYLHKDVLSPSSLSTLDSQFNPAAQVDCQCGICFEYIYSEPIIISGLHQHEERFLDLQSFIQDAITSPSTLSPFNSSSSSALQTSHNLEKFRNSPKLTHNTNTLNSNPTIHTNPLLTSVIPPPKNTSYSDLFATKLHQLPFLPTHQAAYPNILTYGIDAFHQVMIHRIVFLYQTDFMPFFETPNLLQSYFNSHYVNSLNKVKNGQNEQNGQNGFFGPQIDRQISTSLSTTLSTSTTPSNFSNSLSQSNTALASKDQRDQNDPSNQKAHNALLPLPTSSSQLSFQLSEYGQFTSDMSESDRAKLTNLLREKITFTKNEFTSLPPLVPTLSDEPRQVCTHKHHYLCVLLQLHHSTRSLQHNNLSFNFLRCSLCNKYIFHPLLATQLIFYFTLEQYVQSLAIEQLYTETFYHRPKHVPDIYSRLIKYIPELSNPSPLNIFYHRPDLYAMAKLVFYMCFKCGKPYYAGAADCNPHQFDSDQTADSNHPSIPYFSFASPLNQQNQQDIKNALIQTAHVSSGQIEQIDYFPNSTALSSSPHRQQHHHDPHHHQHQQQRLPKQNQLICNRCNPMMGQVSTCNHDETSLIYKCRFCCNPSSYVCWGNTFFCAEHHHPTAWQSLVHQKTGLNKLSLREYPQCPSISVHLDRLRKLHGLNVSAFENAAAQVRCDPKMCPLGLAHPPNGINFVIGCLECGGLYHQLGNNSRRSSNSNTSKLCGIATKVDENSQDDENGQKNVKNDQQIDFIQENSTISLINNIPLPATDSLPITISSQNVSLSNSMNESNNMIGSNKVDNQDAHVDFTLDTSHKKITNSILFTENCTETAIGNETDNASLTSALFSPLSFASSDYTSPSYHDSEQVHQYTHHQNQNHDLIEYRPYYWFHVSPLLLEFDCPIFTQLSLFSYLHFLQILHQNIIDTPYSRRFSQRFLRRQKMSPNDANGLLFTLGTMGHSQQFINPHLRGLVECTSTSLAVNSLPAWGMLQPEDGRCLLNERKAERSWFQLDLKLFKIIPTGYSFKNYSSNDHEFLENWVLEGSLDGQTWVTLSKKNDDTTLYGKSSGGYWPIPLFNDRWQQLNLAQIHSNDGQFSHPQNSHMKYFISPNQLYPIYTPIAPSSVSSSTLKHQPGSPGRNTQVSKTTSYNLSKSHSMSSIPTNNILAGLQSAITVSGTHHESIAHQFPNGFRFFRLATQHHSQYLPCLGFELYGVLIIPSFDDIRNELKQTKQRTIEQLLEHTKANTSSSSLQNDSPSTITSTTMHGTQQSNHSLTNTLTVTDTLISTTQPRIPQPLRVSFLHHSRLLPNVFGMFTLSNALDTPHLYIQRALGRQLYFRQYKDLLINCILNTDPALFAQREKHSSKQCETDTSSDTYFGSLDPVLDMLQKHTSIPTEFETPLETKFTTLYHLIYTDPFLDDSDFTSDTIDRIPSLPGAGGKDKNTTANTGNVENGLGGKTADAKTNAFTSTNTTPSKPNKETVATALPLSKDPPKNSNKKQINTHTQSKKDRTLNFFSLDEQNNFFEPTNSNGKNNSTSIIHPFSLNKSALDNSNPNKSSLNESTAHVGTLLNYNIQPIDTCFNKPQHPEQIYTLLTSMASTIYPINIYSTFHEYSSLLDTYNLQMTEIHQKRQKKNTCSISSRHKMPPHPVEPTIFSFLANFNGTTASDDANSLNPAQLGFINIRASNLTRSHLLLLNNTHLEKNIISSLQILTQPASKSNQNQQKALHQISKHYQSPYCMISPYTKILPSIYPQYTPTTFNGGLILPIPTKKQRYSWVLFDFGAYRIQPTAYFLHADICSMSELAKSPLARQSTSTASISQISAQTSSSAQNTPNFASLPLSEPASTILPQIMTDWIIEGSNGEFPHPHNSPLPFLTFSEDVQVADQLRKNVQETTNAIDYRKKIAYCDDITGWTWYPLMLHVNDLALQHHVNFEHQKTLHFHNISQNHHNTHSNGQNNDNISDPQVKIHTPHAIPFFIPHSSSHNSSQQLTRNTSHVSLQSHISANENESESQQGHEIYLYKKPTNLNRLYIPITEPAITNPHQISQKFTNTTHFICHPESKSTSSLHFNPDNKHDSITHAFGHNHSISDCLLHIEGRKSPPISSNDIVISNLTTATTTTTTTHTTPHPHGNFAFHKYYIDNPPNTAQYPPGYRILPYTTHTDTPDLRPIAYKYIRIRSLHHEKPLYLSDVDFQGTLYTTTSSIGGRLHSSPSALPSIQTISPSTHQLLSTNLQGNVLPHRYNNLNADFLSTIANRTSTTDALAYTHQWIPKLYLLPTIAPSNSTEMIIPLMRPVVNYIISAISFNYYQQHYHRIATSNSAVILDALHDKKKGTTPQPHDRYDNYTNSTDDDDDEDAYINKHSQYCTTQTTQTNINNYQRYVHVGWDILLPKETPVRRTHAALNRFFAPKCSSHTDVTVSGGLATSSLPHVDFSCINRTRKTNAILQLATITGDTNLHASLLPTSFQTNATAFDNLQFNTVTMSPKPIPIPQPILPDDYTEEISTPEGLQIVSSIRSIEANFLPFQPFTNIAPFFDDFRNLSSYIDSKTTQVSITRQVIPTIGQISHKFTVPLERHVSKNFKMPTLLHQYLARYPFHIYHCFFSTINLPEQKSFSLFGIFQYLGERGNTQRFLNPSGCQYAHFKCLKYLISVVGQHYMEFMFKKSEDLQPHEIQQLFLEAAPLVQSPPPLTLQLWTQALLYESPANDMTLQALSLLQPASSHDGRQDATGLQSFSTVLHRHVGSSKDHHYNGDVSFGEFEQLEHKRANLNETLTVLPVARLFDAIPLRFATHVFSSKPYYSSLISIPPISILTAKQKENWTYHLLINSYKHKKRSPYIALPNASINSSIRTSNDIVDPYIIFDMGPYNRLLLTAYSFCVQRFFPHFSGASHSIPTNWQILGSTNGLHWNLLSNHINDETLLHYTTAVWSIPPPDVSPNGKSLDAEALRYHHLYNYVDPDTTALTALSPTYYDHAFDQYTTPSGLILPINAFRFIAIVPLHSPSQPFPHTTKIDNDDIDDNGVGNGNGNGNGIGNSLFSFLLPSPVKERPPYAFSLSSVEFFGTLISSPAPLSNLSFPVSRGMINLPFPYHTEMALNYNTTDNTIMISEQELMSESGLDFLELECDAFTFHADEDITTHAQDVQNFLQVYIESRTNPTLLYPTPTDLHQLSKIAPIESNPITNDPIDPSTTSPISPTDSMGLHNDNININQSIIRVHSDSVIWNEESGIFPKKPHPMTAIAKLASKLPQIQRVPLRYHPKSTILTEKIYLPCSIAAFSDKNLVSNNMNLHDRFYPNYRLEYKTHFLREFHSLYSTQRVCYVKDIFGFISQYFLTKFPKEQHTLLRSLCCLPGHQQHLQPSQHISIPSGASNFRHNTLLSLNDMQSNLIDQPSSFCISPVDQLFCQIIVTPGYATALRTKRYYTTPVKEIINEINNNNDQNTNNTSQSHFSSSQSQSQSQRRSHNNHLNQVQHNESQSTHVTHVTDVQYALDSPSSLFFSSTQYAFMTTEPIPTLLQQPSQSPQPFQSTNDSTMILADSDPNVDVHANANANPLLPLLLPHSSHVPPKIPHTISIDTGILIQPKAYSLAHSNIHHAQLQPQDSFLDSATNVGFLRSWDILASSDAITWNVISTHLNDATIVASGIKYTFALNNVGQSNWYRFFQLRLTDMNDAGQWSICLSHFDLEGFILCDTNAVSVDE